MVLCGTKDGSSGIAVKNLLSTFNFKSVDTTVKAIAAATLIRYTFKRIT